MKQRQLDEVVAFFKGNETYTEICHIAAKKYRSFGQITGSFSLAKLNKQDVAGLLGVSEYSLAERKSYSFQKLLDVYYRGRFANIPFETVVENVVGYSLVSKAEEKSRISQERELFWVRLRANYVGLVFLEGHAVLEALYQLVTAGDLDDKALGYLNQAMLSLPAEPTRLPVFSQMVTGNPHAFDLHGILGNALYRLLQVRSGTEWGESSETERKNQILLDNNIIRDDIMNFVTVNGLLADVNKCVHPMWESAVSCHVTWNVPAKHLLQVDSIYPAKGNYIWMIENSSVYSAILDIMPDLPMICTHGQFRYATWLLLKKVQNEHVYFRYAGDFDPEGLQIADNLLQRFPERANVFAMDKGLYKKSKPEKEIQKIGMKKLGGVCLPALLSLKQEMICLGKIGYQEGIFEEIVQEIQMEWMK
ncbi:DUF2399 domain-containing protein [Listeria booriae]|uniref:TIGR02679 domain-containing protein n=1 Tax=Listeria booriae TaxID=1552123 RepID=UPI00162525D4|nr:TIGR02679 domain-containing protein [Listeria booriae]MBC1811582.1 DUF2399 domain-containing protein [Listeria booriae]